MARRHRRGRPVHGILLLDKPSGGSSNHALQKAKRLFGAAKAGHTGSLDPLATGMLPICFGEATKLSAFLLDADKGYETTLKLGITTNSADADGEVVQERPVPADLDRAAFEKICAQFMGPIMQVPPMVSAIKIDGKRLYKLAREGIEVDRPPRPVTIHSLEVLSFSGDTARLAVCCSKGTYIRSLVTDIGEAIGCGAHVSALRRTFVSPFEQMPMISIETLEQMMAQLSAEAPDSEGPEKTQTSEVQPIYFQPSGSVGSPGVAPSMNAPDSAQSSDAERAVVQPPDASLWPILDALLLPSDAGLGHLPSVTLDAGADTVFGNGNPASCQMDFEPDPSEKTLCRVYDSARRLAGLGEVSDVGRVSPRRVLQWD